MHKSSSRNWNQGLELGMSFDGITILHADDRLNSDYAQSIVDAKREHEDATAFFTRTEIIDGRGNTRFSFPDWYKTTLLPKGANFALDGVEGVNALIPGNFIFCPTLCFIPSKLKQERFQEDLKQVPDFELILRILLKNEKLVGLYEKPLYQYRRHENNTTNLQNKSLLRFKEERDLYLSLSARLDERGQHQPAKNAKRMKVLRLNLLFNFAKAVFTGQFKSAGNFMSFLVQLG